MVWVKGTICKLTVKQAEAMVLMVVVVVVMMTDDDDDFNSLNCSLYWLEQEMLLVKIIPYFVEWL